MGDPGRDGPMTQWIAAVARDPASGYELFPLPAAGAVATGAALAVAVGE
jgi:hypothetical protein